MPKKRRLAWFKWYPENFDGATELDTDEEVGLYLRLIHLAARLFPELLPADPKQVCRLMKRTAHNAPKVQRILDKYWTLTESGWMQSRLQMELQLGYQTLEQRVANFRPEKSAKSRKTKHARRPNGASTPKRHVDPQNLDLSKDKSAREARGGDFSFSKGEGREVLEKWARHVKEGRGFVANTLKPEVATAMLEADLVTKAELAAAGVVV